MAVSYPTRRLYWVDAKKQTIMSCDIDGGDVTMERNLHEASEGNPVFGLVVIGNNAIVSTWFNTRIASTYVATREAFWRTELEIAHSTELYSLVSTGNSMQPPSFHPCGQGDKGGCTHLCLPTRGTSYKCACPTYGGLALSFNAKSCEAPSELLFFTLRDSGEVGFISLRGAQSPYLTLAGRSSQPSAVTYDPIKQVVYWSDVKEGVIYRSTLAGTGDQEIFLNSTNGIGIVDGLAIDWVSRHLYFTNMGQSTPGLDGAVYSWHRLEKIALDGSSRRTVVTDVDRPRGVAIDLDNGLLFFGDWGKQPRISQSLLDGSQVKVILDKDLSNPNGLTFYDGNLYVADSNFNNKTSSPHLMLYNVESKAWTQLKLSSNVSLPMGLAVQGDTLYYSDWVSTDSLKGYVKSYNLRFGVDNNVILSGRRPTGLLYSPMARRKQESLDAVCEESLCSHGCVRMPLNKEKPYQCVCSDESTRVLSSNQATCARPQNFLLVADLNTLKLVSLDDNTDTRSHNLLYSDVKSNFVALAFDKSTDTVYWSDLTKQSIFSSPFSDFEPHLVYKANHYIDGIAVDTEKQRLFWTGYMQNGSGVIVRLNLQRGSGSYHEILQGLNNPRAIHIYPKKKLIFWTEYGGNSGPACVNKAKINGRHPKMLMSHGLFWPNALATHKQRLYVADGAGKVFVMNFDGRDLEELSFLTGSALHIFGLVIMDTVLFYSDWFTNSVYMVDRVTGQTSAVVEHLSRPTSIVVYHPTNLTETSQCQTEGQKCAETCVPVPRGFHCTCSIGSKLASDGFNCIKMASPWELTEESRCGSQCHQDAYCSQLVPLLQYQCVCKTGYEGDGIRCSECGEDFYKPLLGNDTCYPCPVGSTTMGSTTASQCYCTNPQHRLVNALCTDATTTTSTSTTTSEPMEPKTEEDFNLSSQMPDPTTEFPGMRLPEGTIGAPYFENCPHGETMMMRLPETSNRIWLPINWTARNVFGDELKSISNFNTTENKILIPWVANGRAGVQTVVFEAKDQWDQIATCQFQVLLEDFIPPKFSSCPHNIVQKTSMNREPITWQSPTATDNVHEPKVMKSHEPKSEFGVGNTMVTYTATDGAGNTATCTFNVTLIHEQPCDLPEIKYGAFVCGTEYSDICHIMCSEGYILNPLGMFPRSFKCMIDSDVADLTKVMKRRSPCLKRRRPTTAHQEFSISFKGPCRPNDAVLKAELREKVIDKLESMNLCLGATCTHSPIRLDCGPVVKRRRYAEESFNMTWNVTIEYVPPQQEIYDGFSRGQVERIVTDMKLELKKLVPHLNVFLRQQAYRPAARSFSTRDFQWLCLSGEMKIMDGCVPCPPGSYLNHTLMKCMLCDEGFYQNTSSQTKCVQCSEGITMEAGAVNKTECVTFPAINEMSKFLIITACSFGFVFLCLVIFMFLQYKHQVKKNKGSQSVTNNSRYMTPNLYAQAPAPNQKCPDYIRGTGSGTRDYFMNSHDYEDIDGHHKSAFETFSRQAPGCRDSLSSFKAPTDLTFLQSPSPNGNSFRGHDDIMMPSSPRESTKAFHLHGDGGFQYTISPNGTMGSFKGSPPSSPYRSLHFGGSGPVSKGSSESPTHSSHTLSSLIGDESPYTSRLIRDRLIDPDSPYRIISHERRTGSESPYKRKIEVENPHGMQNDPVMMNHEGPYRLVAKESPYRSPALQRELAQSLRVNTDMPPRSPGPAYPQATDVQNSLRSVHDSPSLHRQMSTPREDPSAFLPVGDFLYKRPPSPLSPPISSRKSTDSLQRSPSTPRASPSMSRRRIDGSYRTPPMSQRRKAKNEMGIYEYD
ncbi:uncharacterized protein LOC101861747 [Aplysia californica]|uniref:Uncharacterized protein LOC101861747 n=1 Tax=Aplysia californica TaxID=6500 RepID=A0ABM1A4E5_APLCA|nr:uncharacterized protein LOC101861747 [Aplysia californica]